MGADRHSWAAVAILAVDGSRASWFVGDREGHSSVGGRRHLWVVNGGGWSFTGSGRSSWLVVVVSG